MAGLVYLVVFLQLIILAESTHTTRMPSSFNFSTLGVLAANGSSAVGGCSSVTLNLVGTSTCNDPSSSVLFDGSIPTLAALDGDTWARQLMILYRPEFSRYYNLYTIYLGFTTSSKRRVEVTIFNCPQWGTGVERIHVNYRFSSNNYRSLVSAIPTVISCTSLLKVCIPFPTNASYTNFSLDFSLYSGVKYVHIAEIAFYNSSTPCPPFTTIPGNWTPPPPGAEQTQPSNSSSQQNVTMTEGSINITLRASSLLAVITLLVVLMTLQTTAIFIVVTVVACRKKGKASVNVGAESKGTSESFGEQMYETVDEGENGRVTTFPDRRFK